MTVRTDARRRRLLFLDEGDPMNEDSDPVMAFDTRALRGAIERHIRENVLFSALEAVS